MKLQICIDGDEILRQHAKEVAIGDTSIKGLVSDMFETLDNTIGCGLSAPQIGKSLRLFIVDGSKYGNFYPECAGFKKTFINPVITKTSRKTNVDKEGCLSVPVLMKEIKRFNEVTVEYYDEEFIKHKEKFSGFIARIIQHEYDHLEGRLITDYE